MRDGCPFCDYGGPNDVLRSGRIRRYDLLGRPVVHPYYVIEPLNPVTPGHFLVIPEEHAPDFRGAAELLGVAMEAAAGIAADLAADEAADGDDVPGCNLIVSAGALATQTVPHVHVHIVPRRHGDGLALPWSSGS